MKLAVELLLLFLGLLIGLLAEFPHFRVRHQLLGIRLLLHRREIGAVAGYDGLQVVSLPQELRRLHGVGVKIRQTGLEFQFLKAALHRTKFV